jgi:MoCo/4Fe-4S cofactor protein with predicted Tat translocation signal
MPSDPPEPVSPAARQALSKQEYWRSLEERAEHPALEAVLRREFAQQVSAGGASLNRREFLKLMSASLALAGLEACTSAPPEKIVPYVQQPEQIVPGKSLFFATAMAVDGYATGLLVESHEGRPTKIEGNPNHPASLGSTDAIAQAAILDLYDPDRAGGVKQRGQPRAWGEFLAEFRRALDTRRARRGAGLRLLTETVTSPALADQLRRIRLDFPEARWHQYTPLARDNTRAGAVLAFGEAVEPIYHLELADMVLALDADFLAWGPGHLRYSRDFGARRKVHDGPSANRQNRLYMVESTPSITTSMADHRQLLRPSEIAVFARSLAARLGLDGGPIGTTTGVPARWLDALVADLQAHRGTSLVIAGEPQPPAVHALAHLINQALGNAGKTVSYIGSVQANPIDQAQSLRELAGAMDAGQVELLVMLGGNPAYNAPIDLDFGTKLAKVPLSVHLGTHDDETSALSAWHIPEAHFLESWADTRAFDGTASIVQPLIMPLYGGRSAHEVLDAFFGQPRSDHDVVKAYWQGQHPSGDFETFWRTALHDGLVANTASPARTLSAKADAGRATASPTAQATTEIVFRPDPNVGDGRFANNGWLQELPKPISKLTWDNAVLVSPALAQRLGFTTTLGIRGGEHGQVEVDVVEVIYQQRSIRGPVWITPGQPDDTLTVQMGYGRRRAGSNGSGVGYNAYALRTSGAPWFDTGAAIRRTGERYVLATTQFDQLMEGRDLVRSATAQEFSAKPDFAHVGEPAAGDSLYPPMAYTGYKWGMAIDLNTCTGCSACVVACQAENNIPIVGKTQVMQGREMHWLRIDRYHKGDPANPEVFHQPVPCMHCELAPCEPVCPVGATTHSSEGLNEMTYNRCVGTRYCSNNCPYKVRRFNFLQYQDWASDMLKLRSNPHVSVRSRGVMEKCTYCVQRISAARIAAEKEGRRIRDGEVVPACAAACPADAIAFGDMNDPQSRVAQLKANARNYALLAELNTRPRTTYLAAVRNPNPAIESS